jgi:hypothetical protein
VAAAFGCIATLGAQTSTTATSGGQRTPVADKARDVTVTGCLSKAADGKFMLTNARMEDPTSAPTTAGSSTSTGSTAGTSAAGTTTAGTTAGTAAGTSTSTSTTAGQMAGMSHPAATAWMLSGGNDLEKHVGHKIQVIGRTGWDTNSMDHGRTPDTTAAAGSPAATVGTSGSTATAASEEQRKDMRADQPRLDVQSIKMIASSCS